MNNFKTGAELLAAFGKLTREQKLERAVTALMSEIDDLHVKYERTSLKEGLHDLNMFCSCIDAYRMGDEALKGDVLDQLKELAATKTGHPIPPVLCTHPNGWGAALSELAAKAAAEIDGLRDFKRRQLSRIRTTNMEGER